MLETVQVDDDDDDPAVHLDPAEIEAAVAAAESFGKSNNTAALDHNPLGGVVAHAQEALHAAAQLAAAGASGLVDDDDDDLTAGKSAIEVVGEPLSFFQV